jgi:hypothetical protein
MSEPNALARHVLEVLLARHPDWTAYADVRDGGELVLAVPAPEGSRAKALVVLTHQGQDIWLRIAPPRAFYPIGSDEELLHAIDAFLADAAFFLIVTNGDEWLETTLLPANQEPVLAEGQVANVVSWSGRHDRIVTPGAARGPESRH